MARGSRVGFDHSHGHFLAGAAWVLALACQGEPPNTTGVGLGVTPSAGGFGAGGVGGIAIGGAANPPTNGAGAPGAMVILGAGGAAGGGYGAGGTSSGGATWVSPGAG